MKKGYIHTLEAVLTTIIVLGFVLYVIPNLVERDIGVEALRTNARGALERMDENGNLRTWVINNNMSAIKNELTNILPASINITVSLANTTTDSTLDTLPENTSVRSVSYIIAGVNSTFRPTKIRVYMWW